MWKTERESVCLSCVICERERMGDIVYACMFAVEMSMDSLVKPLLGAISGLKKVESTCFVFVMIL